MIKTLLFFCFLLITDLVFCQTYEKVITGKIISDSLSVENIHIINTNSNIATLSNKLGEFSIPIKLNDTLLFSSIQFENKKIVIQKRHLSILRLTIKLEIDINFLDEVIVKSHQLSGNLSQDALAYNHSINEKLIKALTFNSSKIVSDYDKAKTYTPEFSVDPIPQSNGIDFAQLFRLINININRKGETKKKPVDITTIIKQKFDDVFFISKLKLNKTQIDEFIKHCITKDYNKLVNSGKTIELIDFMIKESKVFLLDLNNEKK